MERALELLRDELLRDMALLGCSNLAELDQRKVRCVGSGREAFTPALEAMID